MKKLTFILLTVLTLTLTGCGASSSTEVVSSTQTDASSQTLSGSTLLLLGTLKLDGTEQAVTPEQAKELLPLWQVYQEISTSDTAAQAEIDALKKQIEETMTGPQMKAINAMNLTPQDTFAIMKEMGIQLGMERRSSSSSNSNDNGNFMPGPGMGAGGGVPPDMGGGAPGGVPGQGTGGQNLSQEQIATAQAARSQGMGGNLASSALLNALIEYLQKVAGL